MNGSTAAAPDACGLRFLERANDLEPAPTHRRLREHCPVHAEPFDAHGFHVVSRHADVLSVLLAPEVWGNRDGPGVQFQPGGVLGSADDPDHRRQRKVLQHGFRPAVIDALAPAVDRIADELWNAAFAADGEGDFVGLFAFPFPAIVIAELLGVPLDERDRFGEWSDDIVAGLGGGDLARVDRARTGIHRLVHRLVDERQAVVGDGDAEPPDDVLTVLARAELDGTLDRGEVIQLGLQLLVAGHETTASLISLMLYRLIEQPHLRDELRARPELIESAVEEFLRFDSPVQGLFRTNQEPATVRGVAFPPGSKLQVLFASANRDDERWDDPDVIRVDRFEDGTARNPHLAFGWGVHHCIGAPLARREGRTALRLILERFDEIELVGDVAVNEPFILRGLTTLPIRWTLRR